MSNLSRSTLISPSRWAVVVFLLTNAAIHMYLTPDHLMEAPYIGVLFIALSVASAILAVLLTITDNALAWAAIGSLNLLALVAFLASRTVGLPLHDHDIGNWSDPLGYASIAVETLSVAVAAAVLLSRQRSTPRSVSAG